MPDSAALEMPDQGQSKGIPSWVMLIGAVAGIAGLALLLKGGGGGGTTAAGTSINAALGSIQEENMNLLGVTQSGFQNMGTQMGAGFGSINQGMTQGFLNTQQQIGGLGTQMSDSFTQTNGLIGTLEHDILGQLSAFSNQTQQSFANTNSLIASGQATQAQINASESSLLNSIQADVQSGLVGQQQANGLLNSIQAGVNANGSFLGWQFYQLPNRYSAYILPGVNPAGWQ